MTTPRSLVAIEDLATAINTFGESSKDVQLAVYRTGDKETYDPIFQLGLIPTLKINIIHTLILTNCLQGIGSEGLSHA